MASCDVIVVGASAGGVEALKILASGLPSTLPAAVFVVLHVWPAGKSILPEILTSAGPLRAQHPFNGASIERGNIYVAPPDYHMTLANERIHLTRGPKENRHRPAVDPLFRSAALHYGPRVAGVVLTGSLDDGTAGLIAIKLRGGKAIVQDPRNAVHPGMPESALAAVEADYVLSITEIPAVLTALATQPAEPTRLAKDPGMAQEVGAVEANMAAFESANRPGKPSVFSCPDCNGTLWEVEEGEFLRFRCRVGHAYTADHLAMEQSEALERALWAGLRALEENATLYHRMAERALRRDSHAAAQSHEEHAANQEKSAKYIRDILFQTDRSSLP